MSAAEAADFLPIWSCSVWGLPCPRHYWSGGALLPHLFTLTAALSPRRYVFCGTFRPPGLNLTSRTLSGTLLCGVRTFLSPRRAREAAVRSGCLQKHYIDLAPQTSDLGSQTFDLRLQFGSSLSKCDYEAGVTDSLYTEDARPNVLRVPGLRAEV